MDGRLVFPLNSFYAVVREGKQMVGNETRENIGEQLNEIIKELIKFISSL